MRTLFKRYYRKYKMKRAIQLAEKPSYVLPNNIKRIYHVHIRKSAGTSLNAAFWSLGNLSLQKLKREPISIGKKLAFVRNNKDLIEQGNYFYANSHTPFWNLNLPENTFTYCMLRDPYKRLVSLYKYYNWVAQTPEKEALKAEPYYNSLIKHVHWLGDCFSDFLDTIPKKHIANQLFMFSENYRIDEAVLNIKKVNKIYFQEEFDVAISDLSETLKLPLKSNRERKFGEVTFSISSKEKEKAMELLKDEYEFYNLVKNTFN